MSSARTLDTAFSFGRWKGSVGVDFALEASGETSLAAYRIGSWVLTGPSSVGCDLRADAALIWCEWRCRARHSCARPPEGLGRRRSRLVRNSLEQQILFDPCAPTGPP